MTTETRGLILRTLRTRGRCSVRELAEVSRVSLASVRHHLANLQADNFVTVEEERHGVGRPRLLFSLTEAGLDLFPSRYVRLTNRLLSELKQSLSSGQVQALMTGIATSMATEVAGQLEGLPLEQRLERLLDWLAEEGFEAEIERQEGQIRIRELSCPYFRIGRLHPEVCHVGQSFLASALSLPVERVTCQLQGDNACTFLVSLQSHSGETPS